MAIKSTFTLDDVTVQQLRRLAERTGKAQSLVVREAIAQYAAQEEKSTPEERARWLHTFEELLGRVAPRPASERARETTLLRQSRKGWSRRADR